MNPKASSHRQAYGFPLTAIERYIYDQTTYLGNQLESEFGGDRYFGILANMNFIMICTYEAEGANPELLLYKKDKLNILIKISLWVFD